MNEAPEYVDLSWGRSFVHGFPHEYFTWLRREHPVFWHEPTEHTPGDEGFWVISRHADAMTIMADPGTYSSELAGTQISGSSRGPGLVLNMLDDPRHLWMRSLINRGFTPRMIGRLEDDLIDRTNALLDAVPRDEPFDFVRDVARELPLQAICSVLGIPQDDREELADLVDAAIESETGEVFGLDELRAIGRYAAGLIEKKRTQPADDILSIIVHATDDDGEKLSDTELKGFFNLLFPAGAETTNRSIAGGVVTLLDHPEQLEALRADRELMGGAIEEILRWTSPSVYKRRTPTRDVELGGKLLKQGSRVTYWEMSANRDEDVFEDPFRFDITRNPNPHVAFGFGAHFCLGANLARLELKVMLNGILDRLPHLELADEPGWTPNNRLVGVNKLSMLVRS